MSNFWFFLDQGFKHILDWSAYDHLLFLVVLSAPYLIKQWRKLLALITLFTIGHTLSLVLSVYDIVNVNMSLIEFLIPLTIILTAIMNIFRIRKNTTSEKPWGHWVATLAFGIIHGFGFSTLFKMMIASASQKATPLLAYTLGIEFAQILIVIVMLIISFIVISLLVIIISAIIIGRILPIFAEAWEALSI